MSSYYSGSAWLLKGFSVCTIALILFGDSDPFITFVLVSAIILGLVIWGVKRIEWTRRIRSGALNGYQIRYLTHGTPQPLGVLFLLGVMVLSMIVMINLEDVPGLTIPERMLIPAALIFWLSLPLMLPREYAITDEGIWTLVLADTIFIPFVILKKAIHYKSRFSPFSKSLLILRGTFNLALGNYIILHATHPTNWLNRKQQPAYCVTPSNPTEFLSHLPDKLTASMEE